MNHKFIILFAILLFALIRVNAQIDIAVLNLDSGVGVSEESVKGLQNMLVTELHNMSEFRIKERSRTSDIWKELSRKKGSTLTKDEFRIYGTRLGVDAIVVGTVNYQVRKRSLEDIQTGMSRGEYNVDIRLVSIETGNIISTGGDVQKDNETTRELMRRITHQLLDNYVPEISDEYEEIKPTILLGYLSVYPKDIGSFTTDPRQFIKMINKQKMYGYSDWRLPADDELDLLLSNKTKVGLRMNQKYGSQSSVFSELQPLAVRLVRSEVLISSPEEVTSHPFLEPESKELGTIPLLKREVSTSFEIVNPTASTIYIDQIKCLSSNTHIKDFPSKILSGESVSITVTIQTAKRQGVNIQRDVKVYIKGYEPLLFKIYMSVE